MPVGARVLVVVVVLTLAAACGSAGSREASVGPGVDPPVASAAVPMPTRVPPARGTVTTSVAVTVLDDGEGPVACLGAVAMSLPPQCDGPRLVGFRWSDHRGQYDVRAGVRWGLFVVTGSFDGRDLTPTEVTKPDGNDAPHGSPAPPDPDLSTPCPAPPGGWRVLDRASSTDDSLDRVTRLAGRLPGYADLWLDQSRNPAYGRDGVAMTNDPAHVTLNVAVTRSVGAAEARLRKVWGGALCVTKAPHTEASLRRIQQALEHLPGMLTASSGFGHVDVEVVHDDGSLQAWADRTYGRGLVRISSALVPASG